jgi:hypothetical protein
MAFVPAASAITTTLAEKLATRDEMTTSDKLRDVNSRMAFLRKDAERITALISAQGYRTEEQTAEVDMMRTLADELQTEVQQLIKNLSIPDVFKPPSGRGEL